MNTASTLTMINSIRAKRHGMFLFTLAAILLVGLVGCDRGPAMSKVSGKVAFTNGSIPTGATCLVFFQPASDTTAEIRKGATGPIEPDGTFEMWTRRPGDGVYHGNYVVTFSISKSSADRTSLIAEKYRMPDTTPYKVKVDQKIDDLKFELEPAGGATAAGAAAAKGGAG